MPKAISKKAPAFQEVKKLTFRQSPELKAAVMKVGVKVQRELETESKSRSRSIDQVLRAVVR